MRLALVLCMLVACKERSTPRDAATRPPHGELRGTFQLTYYWIPVEDDLPGPATTKLFDRDCKRLAKTSSKFAQQASLAGAGKLADGRMLTVDGYCKCPRSPCFRIDDHPWGMGADSRALVPFHSLAVDRDVLAIGATLFIPDVEGIALPGYFSPHHDGCFVADDVGGNITGKQIDWFVARQPYYRELDTALHLTEVRVYDGGARCAR